MHGPASPMALVPIGQKVRSAGKESDLKGAGTPAEWPTEGSAALAACTLEGSGAPASTLDAGTAPTPGKKKGKKGKTSLFDRAKARAEARKRGEEDPKLKRKSKKLKDRTDDEERDSDLQILELGAAVEGVGTVLGDELDSDDEAEQRRVEEQKQAFEAQKEEARQRAMAKAVERRRKKEKSLPPKRQDMV